MKEQMDIIQDYKKTIDGIYGAYLDSVEGYSLVKKQIEQAQLNQIEINKELKNRNLNRHYNLSVEDFDSSCIVYSDGDKDSDNYRILHYCCTQKEYKERNSHSGRNYRFVGNMCLISIFQYWEDYFRSKIAYSLSLKETKDLKSDIMGDVGKIRRSIIHHRGIALPDIEKCKILRWYKRGEEIFIDKEKLETIISEIYLYLNELKKT
jgi:hypothetical protein